MTNEEKIVALLEKHGKVLEGLQQDIQDLKKGQERSEQILGQHTTALKTLTAGQQDNAQELAEQFEYIKNLAVQLKHLRAVVVTKPELDLSMEMAIKEINARIDLAVISLAKKVQSHERRLNNSDIPDTDKH